MRSISPIDSRTSLHDVFRQIVRDPRQVVGVERLGDLDEAVVRCLADQPRPDRRIDLDDGLGGLPRVECGPRPQPIVRLQPFEDKPQVGGMQSAEPALQLRGVLAFLQLDGNAPPRPILVLGERLERAVMLEQLRNVDKGLMEVGRGSSLLHVTPNLHRRYDGSASGGAH